MAGPGCRICRARRPDAGPGAAVRGVLPAVRRLPRHRRNLAAQFPCRFRRPGRGQTAPLRAAPVRAAGDVAPRSATPREDADAATLPLGHRHVATAPSQAAALERIAAGLLREETGRAPRLDALLANEIGSATV